jgi:hypothetical protein
MKDTADIKNLSVLYLYISRGVIDALGAMAGAVRPFKKRIYGRTGQ